MALSIAQIRTYVKDMPVFNVLLQGNPQSSDDLINLAIELSVSDFNSTPPMAANFTVENFPESGILIYGVLHHLANAEAERQLRNQVDYNLQGLTTAVDNKFAQYNQLAGYYKQLFDQKINAYKTYLNQEKAWGGMFSPFSAINTYNFRD